MSSLIQNISKKTFVWISISILFYVGIAYHLNRTEFYKLLFLYSGLFLAFIALVFENKNNPKLLFVLSVFFRLVLLFSIPNLSDDFYRFIWDGRLSWQGMNPYLYLPESDPYVIAEGEVLYQGMGEMNGSHYTCYPPINQFAFLVPAILFAKNMLGSTIVLRMLLILADIGTYFVGKKLLDFLKLPSYKIFFYLLNPFVILELTGNLHFEGLMIFFLVLSLYFLFTKKQLFSALFFALSVSVKLIPLLFLPLLIKRLGLKKSISYFVVVILLNILFFVPFMSQELVVNFMGSIHLYFQNFEFNASIYYLIREVGFFVKGYNIIHSVGKITPILVLSAVLLLAVFRKNSQPRVLISSMLFAICIYYSLASVVHPWYIAIPLFFSIFTKYKFPLVWSFFILLSYSAYTSDTVYQENLFLVGGEYVMVYGTFIWELFFRKNYRGSFLAD